MIDDRRHFTRQIVSPSVYVYLGPRRGGVLSNLSEGGLAVAVRGLPLSGQIVPVGFELAEAQSGIETICQVAWRDKLGTRAGLEFLDLSEVSRQQIKEWLSQKISVGEHQDVMTQPELLTTEPLASPTTQETVKNPNALLEAADLRLEEKPTDSSTSAYGHLIEFGSLGIRSAKTSESRLREQKKVVETDSRGGKSSQVILETRHALALLAGIVLFFGLMFVLGYVLGRS